MACGPGSPELSKSYMDMASKLLTFTSHLQRKTRDHAIKHQLHPVPPVVTA